MSLRSFFLLFCGSALLIGSAVDATAANNLYRYRDSNGTLVIGATVPPELVKNGYEVLSSSGRVIEVVPPAPTPAELAAREAAEVETKRREDEAKKRAAEDEFLLRVYSKPEEAVRARDRRLQEIDGVIGLKRGNIQVLANQIKEIETQAANIERSGRTVPDDMHEQIKHLHANIQELEGEIAQNQKEKQGVEQEFDRKIDRLRHLNSLRDAKKAAASNN